jgi:hypothetical protein
MFLLSREMLQSPAPRLYLTIACSTFSAVYYHKRLDAVCEVHRLKFVLTQCIDLKYKGYKDVARWPESE